MLRALTHCYTDESNNQQFIFSFYCDICGKSWKSAPLPFSMHNHTCQMLSSRKIKNLMWQCEHHAAYERANNEAIFHFNRCPVCQRWMCDDCYEELETICVKCSYEK